MQRVRYEVLWIQSDACDVKPPLRRNTHQSVNRGNPGVENIGNPTFLYFSYLLLWSCVSFIIKKEKSPENCHWPSWPRKGWCNCVSFSHWLGGAGNVLAKVKDTQAFALWSHSGLIHGGRRSIPAKEGKEGNSLAQHLAHPGAWPTAPTPPSRASPLSVLSDPSLPYLTGLEQSPECYM